MENPIKRDDLEVPLFQETSISLCLKMMNLLVSDVSYTAIQSLHIYSI